MIYIIYSFCCQEPIFLGFPPVYILELTFIGFPPVYIDEENYDEDNVNKESEGEEIVPPSGGEHLHKQH